MRLVPKLGLSLFAGVVFVVACYTAWRVRGDIKLFDQDARRDQRVVGTTAAAALAKSRTTADAIRLAHRVDASRERIRIRFVSLRADAAAELRPLLPLSSIELREPGVAYQLVKPKADAEPADLLLTYVAAPVADDAAGAIELSQPLASFTEYAWRGFWSALASSIAMALVGGVMMVFIGARIVGRPISDLIAAARRIGEGNFDVVQSTARNDELGELARAMKTMSEDLAAERQRAHAEAEARIRALEQLRHADRLTTLGQLASVLAHEIGTPLNVIAGHGKMIENGKLSAVGVRDSAAAIGEQCGRITSIVRRVLDYARRKPARRAAIDALDTARTTRAMLHSLAERRGVSLHLDATTEHPMLFADSDQLQQALTNVVLNAVHASPAQSAVSISVDAVDVSRGGQTGDFVVFRISDHGKGIDPKIAAHIFDPFFTTKPPGEGTGLGLSVARDIVEEHGGFIQVAESSSGTVFEIYIPGRLADDGSRIGG